MSAPIPADLRELYDAASTVKEAMPGLWIPHAGPRVAELIERIAAREAQVQQLREALVRAKNEIVLSGNWTARDYGWPDCRKAIDAALAATEPKEKA